MSNKEIINKLKQIVKFIELHGANEFKVRGYQNAIQRLERIHEPLANMDKSQLLVIEGLGKSMAGTISELNNKGTTPLLVQYEQDTPPGLRELMQFRGIGIKKLKTIWSDFGITDKFLLKSLVQSEKRNADHVPESRVNCFSSVVFYQLKEDWQF